MSNKHPYSELLELTAVKLIEEPCFIQLPDLMWECDVAFQFGQLQLLATGAAASKKAAKREASQRILDNIRQHEAVAIADAYEDGIGDHVPFSHDNATDTAHFDHQAEHEIQTYYDTVRRVSSGSHTTKGTVDSGYESSSDASLTGPYHSAPTHSAADEHELTRNMPTPTVRALGSPDGSGRLVATTRNQMRILGSATLHLDALKRLCSEKSVRLFSLDMEMYEFGNKALLEVGIAWTTTCGGTVTSEVHGRHWIVEDHLNLRNGRFVEDNREHYSFGISELVPLDNMAFELGVCLKDLVLKDGVTCLVGHSVSGDIKWLYDSLGVKLLPDIQVVDVADCDVARCGVFQRLSLEKMLRMYNLPYGFLHNAGNDAAYTLQVAVAQMQEVNRELHHVTPHVV